MNLNQESSYFPNKNPIWKSLPITSHHVDQIAFSPDGQILVSSYQKSDETVILWDIVTGQKLCVAKWEELFQTFGGWKGLDFLLYEKCLFFNQDAKKLIWNGFIWDLVKGKLLNVKALKSPFNDSNWCNIAVSPNMQIGVAYYKYDTDKTNVGNIKFWETATSKEIYTIFLGRNVDTENIYANQFSADGKIFASLIWFRHGSSFYPDGMDHEKIKLWEVQTGMEICTITLPEVLADTKYAGVFTFSSNSRILASNCGDTWRRFVLLSDVVTGKEICRFRAVDGLSKKVVSLAFSPDDRILASCDSSGTITMWQLNKGCFKSLKVRKIRTFIGSASNTLTFSPDGRILANGLTLWDVKSGKKLQTFLGHQISGNRVYSNNFHDSKQVAVSADGNTIACIDDSNYKIKLWDTQSGAFIRDIKHKSHIEKVTFSQDDKSLIGAYSLFYQKPQSRIVIWEVDTGKEIYSKKYQGFGGSRCVNQHGDLLAVFQANNSPIKVLQVPTGKTICNLNSDSRSLWQIIFSPDKRFIATRHSICEFTIWEIATSRLIQTIKTDNLEGDTDPGFPDPVLFNPNGEMLAVASIRNITLWKVSSGERIQTIHRPYRSWDSCMAFSPDGKTLAFTEHTFGYSIKLWDIETCSEICVLEDITIHNIISLNFSGNGQVLVSSYDDGTVTVWQQT